MEHEILKQDASKTSLCTYVKVEDTYFEIGTRKGYSSVTKLQEDPRVQFSCLLTDMHWLPPLNNQISRATAKAFKTEHDRILPVMIASIKDKMATESAEKKIATIEAAAASVEKKIASLSKGNISVIFNTPYAETYDSRED